MIRPLFTITVAMLALAPALAPANADVDANRSGFAVTDVRLFDGKTVAENMTVVIRDGRVDQVGQNLTIDDELPTLDGSGHTLLPGLIDAHVHTFGQARTDALRFGVTTLLDMFTSPQMLSGAGEQRERLDATSQADFFSAGMLATAEGGHGTQFGVPVEPVNGPDDAEAWVKRRVAEGSDYIKIIVEDGSTHGRDIATLDEATVSALVNAAHRHERMALAHVSTLADAVMAVRAGVDGLVHVFTTSPPARSFSSWQWNTTSSWSPPVSSSAPLRVRSTAGPCSMTPQSVIS
jgi:imidazolonepropionase-like amidohydrolase